MKNRLISMLCILALTLSMFNFGVINVSAVDYTPKTVTLESNGNNDGFPAYKVPDGVTVYVGDSITIPYTVIPAGVADPDYSITVNTASPLGWWDSNNNFDPGSQSFTVTEAKTYNIKYIGGYQNGGSWDYVDLVSNDKYLISGLVVEAAPVDCGHTTTEIRDAVEATCGADGYTGDTYCTECNNLVTEGSAIPATGEHTYGSWSATTAATPENSGIVSRTCDVCGDVDTKSYSLGDPEDPERNYVTVNQDGTKRIGLVKTGSDVAGEMYRLPAGLTSVNRGDQLYFVDSTHVYVSSLDQYGSIVTASTGGWNNWFQPINNQRLTCNFTGNTTLYAIAVWTDSQQDCNVPLITFNVEAPDTFEYVRYQSDGTRIIYLKPRVDENDGKTYFDLPVDPTTGFTVEPAIGDIIKLKNYENKLVTVNGEDKYVNLITVSNTANIWDYFQPSNDQGIYLKSPGTTSLCIFVVYDTSTGETINLKPAERQVIITFEVSDEVAQIPAYTRHTKDEFKTIYLVRRDEDDPDSDDPTQKLTYYDLPIDPETGETVIVYQGDDLKFIDIAGVDLGENPEEHNGNTSLKGTLLNVTEYWYYDNYAQPINGQTYKCRRAGDITVYGSGVYGMQGDRIHGYHPLISLNVVGTNPAPAAPETNTCLREYVTVYYKGYDAEVGDLYEIPNDPNTGEPYVIRPGDRIRFDTITHILFDDEYIAPYQSWWNVGHYYDFINISAKVTTEGNRTMTNDEMWVRWYQPGKTGGSSGQNEGCYIVQPSDAGKDITLFCSTPWDEMTGELLSDQTNYQGSNVPMTKPMALITFHVESNDPVHDWGEWYETSHTTETTTHSLKDTYTIRRDCEREDSYEECPEYEIGDISYVEVWNADKTELIGTPTSNADGSYFMDGLDPDTEYTFVYHYTNTETRDHKHKTDKVIDVVGFKITHNVQFQNNIALHYYINKSLLQGYTNVRLSIVQENYSSGSLEYDNYVITDWETDINGSVERYHFTIPSITAKRLGDTIYATLIAEDGEGDDCYAPIDVYSVKQYAMNHINKNTNALLTPALVDLLKYAAATQTYFNYNVDNLATDGLTAAQLELGTNTVPDISSIKDIPEDTTGTTLAAFDSVNVSIGEYVNMVYNMTFDEGVNLDDVKLVVSYTGIYGKDYNLEYGSEMFTVDNSNGYDVYSISINDVKLYDARQDITATVYEGEEAISVECSYDIESYIAEERVENSEDTEFVDMVNSMMNYSKTIEAFLVSYHIPD